jgi:hypothetical protein
VQCLNGFLETSNELKDPQENYTVVFITNEFKDTPYVFAYIHKIEDGGMVMQYSKHAYSKQSEASSDSNDLNNLDESVYLVPIEEALNMGIMEIKLLPKPL